MAVSTLNDKTINKIALCSAVVAGFAYVGYSFVRSAFSRQKRKKNQGDEQQHRVLLRRLSQTTQTDALLGELDLSEFNKVILRPKSVQERIRELNVRARQFADAVVAIQTNGTRPHGVCSRSLQATPWGSPRVLSPVEIRHFVPSKSPDTLDHPHEIRDRSPCASPVRYRWNRRSLRSQHRHVEFIAEEDTRTKELETLWTEEKVKILSTLDSLLGPGRNLGLEEAQNLLAVLFSQDENLIIEALVTIANCAAFTESQNALRSAGLLSLVHRLLLHRNVQIQQQACQVISNMALNEVNLQEMRQAVTSLVRLANSLTTTEQSSLLHLALVALTNLAVLPTWHKQMSPILHKLYKLLDEELWSVSDGPSLQSLRLLINLSCNDDMVPSLLAAEGPKRLVYMLDLSSPDQVVLRIATLLANIVSTAKRLKLDPIYDLPAEGKAAAPDTMYAAIYGVNVSERIKRKAMVLAERHSDEDVRFQAHRLVDNLSQ